MSPANNPWAGRLLTPSVTGELRGASKLAAHRKTFLPGHPERSEASSLMNAATLPLDPALRAG
jgi:hypothetical protein